MLKDLLNAGVLPSDAQTLESHYADQDPVAFIDGLELTARCLVTGQNPGLLLPKVQPWRDVLAVMQLNPSDLEQAFNQALANYATPLQIALVGAVTTRMHDLRQWMQQNQTGQGKKRKWAEYIKVLNNLGYTFRYNQCTHNIEVNGDPITDGLAKQIRMRARDAGVWEVNVMEDAYQAQAFQQRYHPIKDYLSGLKFEGGDPIGQLTGHFQDEHGVVGNWLRRWLIGAVARGMAGEQNRMLVLDGPQGCGKSTFVKWLCSPIPDYFHEGPIQPDNKDHKLRLMWTWIWEVNEFGSTARRADREALKAFLTTQTVRERKPYAKFETTGTAITSYIGTVNNESGILSDPTGSRRFMIAHINHIDWDYQRIEVDQVWAQAFDLYLAGEAWHLSAAEIARANEINKEYETVDIVEETIRVFYEVDPDRSDWELPTLEIMNLLKEPTLGNLKAGSEINERRLASALTSLGLEKPKLIRNGNRVYRGYRGIRRKGP